MNTRTSIDGSGQQRALRQMQELLEQAAECRELAGAVERLSPEMASELLLKAHNLEVTARGLRANFARASAKVFRS